MSKILDYANNISVDRFTRIRSSISNSGYSRRQSGSPVFYGLSVDLPLLTKEQYCNVEAELIGLSDGIDLLSTNIPDPVKITDIKGDYDGSSTITVAADSGGNAVDLSGFTNTVTGSVTGTPKIIDATLSPAVLAHTFNNSWAFTLTGGTTVNTTFNVGTTATDFATQLQALEIIDSAEVTSENAMDGAVIRITFTQAAGDRDANTFNGSVIFTTVQEFVAAGTATYDGTNQLNVGDFLQFSNHAKVYQVKSIANIGTNGHATQIRVTLNTPLISNITTADTVNFDQDINFQLLLENSRPNVTVVPGPGYNYYQYDTFNFREVL